MMEGLVSHHVTMLQRSDGFLARTYTNIRLIIIFFIHYSNHYHIEPKKEGNASATSILKLMCTLTLACLPSES